MNAKEILLNALKDLAKARYSLKEKKDALEEMKAEIKPFENEVKKAETAERNLYDYVREQALLIYQEAGKLEVGSDITIANVESAVYNPEVFIQWALHEGRLDLLKIEPKSAAILKAVQASEIPEEIAHIKKEFQVRVASNLNHLL